MSEVQVFQDQDGGRKAFRVFGLPIQFVVVMAISAASVIYLGAWAADSNIEARTVAFGAPIIPTAGDSSVASHRLPADSDSESWESAFLWVCPLH